MKRISFFLIAVFLLAATNLKSQTPTEGTSVLNYSGLESKLKKSDADILDVKKNIKAKTWTNRVQLMVDIYNVHNDLLTVGMEPVRAKIFMKEPKEIQTMQEGSDRVEIYVYDRVDLKFVNGALESWTEKNKIHENPLAEAQKSLDEAIKLNTDTKANADIVKAIENLKLAFQNEAILSYERAQFDLSHASFVKILDLNKNPLMNNRVDTILIYYAGRAALESKNYPESNRLFAEALSYNYEDPMIYVFYKQSLFASGDTAKGVSLIQEGFEKYPEEQGIMIELINYYLAAGQEQAALDLLARAKAGDPSNISFTFTEGTLYERLGRIDDAERAYRICIETKPDYYDAYFNMGVLQYNKAVKIYEEASMIADNTEFEKVQKQGDEMLMKAIPYMEKASQIEPKDTPSMDTKKTALETLKNIYYRLKMEDKRQDTINRLNAL